MPAETNPSTKLPESYAVAKVSKATTDPAVRSFKQSATLLKPTHPLNVSTRALELQRVLDATEVTDAAGARRDREESIDDLIAELKTLRSRGSRLYLVGNGGSASVASHAVTDFLNVASLRAATLHEPSLLTCMSNDYGYEVAFARILATVASHGDMMIAISSSGQSLNIRNAAAEMRRLGGKVVTLSGFKADNPLRSLGELNFWLQSTDYGMVEIGHQFVLHNLADRLRLGL